MNKRCIVNVATGDFYCKMQVRLLKSFEKSIDNVFLNGADLPWRVSNDEFLAVDQEPKYNDTGIDLMIWRGLFPPNSKPHSESPYGFKVHAIKAAYERGYTSVLWLDSPAHSVKEDISPIFEKIEKEGYYAMSHIDPLENYVDEKALDAYAKTYTDLIGLNLPSGSCYGFDFRSSFGKNIFTLIEHDELEGLFKSFQGSTHRHDESMLALALLSLNLPVFTHDPLFQSDSPNCVIRSGGDMKL